MRKRFRNLNLFHKFAASIIIVGLIPMLILSTFIANSMIQEYRKALRTQYEQAAEYIGGSLETMLDSYNTISQMPYYYNYSNHDTVVRDYLAFDNLRQIVHGSGYEPDLMEVQRKSDMDDFLKYVESVDAYLIASHFVGVDVGGEKLDFHYTSNNSLFKDEELFEEVTGYSEIDRTNKKMMLIPTHKTGYFSGIEDPVFTVARNYCDLRGAVGNTPYVGTIFLDVNLERMNQIFRTVKFNGGETIYVLTPESVCLYSNQDEKIGASLGDELTDYQNTEDYLVLSSSSNSYGVRVVVVLDTAVAFQKIRNIQHLMYLFVGMSVIALLLCSIFSSKRLIRPIHAMMKQMGEMESGNFDIQLPVNSGDEIGVLSERFNQMSIALKKYINQYYVAQIKQSEAELTALKSQIYPHFLYNTLEIIRMTALEDGGEKVPEMIEALSEQIHYLIGPVQDMVPLEKEIDIVRKYVYLLNCRINGKVQLSISAPGAGEIRVPKLILQPIVENAYVHGIKPKGKGNIFIESEIHEGVQEISVLDNGQGMDEEALGQIRKLLEGNDPGIKNEYNWQSIGLKNVHDRIRYLFGEEYGIQVTSTPAVGTMVRVLMPIQGKEGDHDKDDFGG